MKKLIILCLLFVLTALLFGETFTVGPGGNYDFTSIQDAIDDQNVEDNDNLVVYTDTYDAIDLDDKHLNIYADSSSEPVIDGDNASIVVNMGNENYSSLSGFTITGSASASGIMIDGLQHIDITNCTIESLNKAIEISSGEYIDIEDCIINESSYGCYIADSWPYNSKVNLLEVECHDNDISIYLNGLNEIEMVGCLFYENDEAVSMTNLSNSIYIDRCTFADNGDVFIWGSNSNVEIVSSIVWDNTGDIFTGTANDLDIDYSCIEDGYAGGTGNIDDDPLFCSEYLFEYWLLEGSPCIDTGDPNTTGGDVRIDMGCYETVKDIKKCEGEYWNWVSYPRLNRSENDSVDVVPLLENFLDWDFHLQMLYDVIFWVDPTLEYENSIWTPSEYDIISSLGYKLNPKETGDHYLPTVNNATRLSDEWQLEYTLEDEDDCWMGYWLPYTQNIEAAFGDLFDDLVSVDAEDWYYEYSKFETPSSSTENKDMVYGKGYVVVFERDIEDFCWTDATSRGGREPGNPRPEPQYFSYNDLPSYEAIDVMEIPPDVIEIGVFDDDTCVGAVVVQDSCEQILAYTDIANRNPLPLTFEVVTNNRGETLVVSDYLVMNKQTGRYENRSIFSGQQKSSVVKFGDLQEPQNNIPVAKQAKLHGNYPNPFNPTTTIAFSVPAEQEVELIIYNMKGQLVRKLVQGVFSTGEHEIIWDGLDKTGRTVGSGLYLYRFKTEDMEISKKMLLLK